MGSNVGLELSWVCQPEKKKRGQNGRQISVDLESKNCNLGITDSGSNQNSVLHTE